MRLEERSRMASRTIVRYLSGIWSRWSEFTAVFLRWILRAASLKSPTLVNLIKREKPFRRDVTHILCNVNCFLLNLFIFVGYRNDKFFFPYKSLYFECYATMPMLADAHISSLGYLCIYCNFTPSNSIPR